MVIQSHKVTGVLLLKHINILLELNQEHILLQLFILMAVKYKKILLFLKVRHTFSEDMTHCWGIFKSTYSDSAEAEAPPSNDKTTGAEASQQQAVQFFHRQNGMDGVPPLPVLPRSRGATQLAAITLDTRDAHAHATHTHTCTTPAA